MKTYWVKWKSGNKETLAEWQALNESDLRNQISKYKGTLVDIVDVIEGTQKEQEEALLKKGHSLNDAIMIHSESSMGVQEEYQILQKIFDLRQLSYEVIEQALLHEGDRHFDRITVALPDGNREDFYFDITLFYGKD